MCLARAYVEQANERKEVMHDVAWIKADGDDLLLATLMGESRRFKARLKSVDLMNGSIVLETRDGDESPE